MASGFNLSMLHYYCFAHERPRFRLDPRITIIELGDPGAAQISDGNAVSRAYDLVPDLAEAHVWLGGSIANFAVLRHLESVNAAPSDRVCISHYRRFLLPDMYGTASPGEPGICKVSPEKSATLDPYELALQFPGTILTSKPWNDGFGQGMTVREQYARAHYVEDLDKYMGLARDLGIVQADTIDAFLNGKQFIPGGIEFSMCPVATYTTLVGKIEKLNRAYLAQYQPNQRSDYQDRFLCYCNERLGSLFLLELLEDTATRQVASTGFMHIVSEIRRIEPGNWAPKTAAQTKTPPATSKSCILHVGVAGAASTNIRLHLRDYDDGQTTFGGNAFLKGYPGNNELIACALEQHEIDACLDFTDRNGNSDLDPRYHRCAWALDDLRKEIGRHPDRDQIRGSLADWVANTSSQRIILSTDNLDCVPFAIHQLCAWLNTQFAYVNVIGYLPTTEAFFPAVLEHYLCAQRLPHLRANWSEPLAALLPDSRALFDRFRAYLGAEQVTIVDMSDDALIGATIVEDFCDRNGLSAPVSAGAIAPRPPSAEAIAVLATYANHVAENAITEANPASRMALHTLLRDFGTKSLWPSQELQMKTGHANGEGVNHLADRAFTAEDGVIISTKEDILRLGEDQIGALRDHMSRRWALKLPRRVRSSQKLGQYLDKLMKKNLKVLIVPTLPSGFDAARYLELNPDVKATGIGAEEHFLKHGYFEGRQT